MAVTITISISGTQVGEISGIAHHANMNVQAAMEDGYNLHEDTAFSFTLQYFGGQLGYEVVSLDGITNQIGTDSGTYVFWALSVNGTFSPTGIDSTPIKDGDVIEWNYQTFDPEQHSGTRHDDVRQALLGGSAPRPAAT